MKVQICFREVTRGHNQDYVPFLWNEEEGAAPGQVITQEDDYSTIIRDILQASNRCRELLVFDTEDAAVAMSALRREERDAISIVTQVGESAWALGSTYFDGSYDSGIPSLTDLRSQGADLELDGDLSEAVLMARPGTDFEPPLKLTSLDALEPALG